MKDNYQPIKSMKEVPEQLRKLLELASDAGAIYHFDSTVLINRDILMPIWSDSTSPLERTEQTAH